LVAAEAAMITVSARERLKEVQWHKTHVQRAYKNPQKQNAAIPISMINCTIIARKESTRRLFSKVTKANLGNT
jgi:hypothetical protein